MTDADQIILKRTSMPGIVTRDKRVLIDASLSRDCELSKRQDPCLGFEGGALIPAHLRTRD